MRIGISSGCLYPMSSLKAVQLLLESGFKRFEIFFNTFSELENDFLDKLEYLFDSFDASVSSIHPFTSSYESFLLFSAYEQRFLDGISFYEMYFRTARKLGADKVVLHGIQDNFSGAITLDEYFRRFLLLAQRAEEYGIMLLQENVYSHRSNDPDFIKQMINALPQYARFVLDTKQAIKSGYDPAFLASVMGNRLRHIHISDVGINGSCLLPGKGSFDFPSFISSLEDYDGDLIIEVYRSSYDQISELSESGKFLEKLII